MKRVLTAVVLIPVVLLLVFRAPLWLFALAVAGIVLLALHEYLNLLKGYGIEPIQRLTYIVSFCLILGMLYLGTEFVYMGFPWRWGILLSPAAVFVLPVIFGIPVIFRKEMRMALPAAGSSAFGVLYICLSIAFLIPLRHSAGNEYLIPFVLFSVWTGDIAAYYVGRSIGRHKLAPIVSPNKSWEGAIASVIASVGVAALVFLYRDSINSLFVQHHEEPIAFLVTPTWTAILVLGVVTNVAAQFGDLFESALKRGAGVKDSGTLLPGHGGVLDRIDALLFAVPTVWYYATFVGLFQQAQFYHPIR